MAITDKNTIYSWFQTDDFPTEAQFRATWDSFWHKSESIPMSQITGLNQLFQQTATVAQLNNKANVDGSNIDVSAYQEKLNITNLIATAKEEVKTELLNGAPEAFDTLKEISDWISDDETAEAAILQAIQNEATARTNADNLLLNKPTTTSNTTSYPFVVGENGNGGSARLPAGDLGKNFFNSDLSNTTARNHTMNAGVTVNTLGNPHTLSGLPNKNTDIANFRKVRVQNASGLDAVVDSKSMLLDMPSYLTEQERTAWKTAMNGGWTTNTMSIGMVYPNVVKYTDDIVYITIYGANLNLPPNSEIKIINIANNTEYVIPNSQVIYGDASKIYFWIKATDFVKAEYKIRIFNGAAIVDTQSNNNLLFVDVLNEIDITSVTWDKKSTTQSQVENVLATSSGTLHFETNDNNAPVNTGGIVASAKSSIIANANENFVFEARVEGKFSYQISGGFKFGLMDFDKENSLLNNLDLDFEMISTTPNWGSARILYDSSNYIGYTNNYSNNNYGDGTFPVELIISKKQNFITVTFIIPRIGVFVYSKMLSNTFGISLGFKGYNRSIGHSGKTTATADVIVKRIYKF